MPEPIVKPRAEVRHRPEYRVMPWPTGQGWVYVEVYQHGTEFCIHKQTTKYRNMYTALTMAEAWYHGRLVQVGKVPKGMVKCKPPRLADLPKSRARARAKKSKRKQQAS